MSRHSMDAEYLLSTIPKKVIVWGGCQRFSHCLLDLPAYKNDPFLWMWLLIVVSLTGARCWIAAIHVVGVWIAFAHAEIVVGVAA